MIVDQNSLSSYIHNLHVNQDQMGDTSNRDPAQLTGHRQLEDWRSRIRPNRERFDCFEEKVYTFASDENAYARIISNNLSTYLPHSAPSLPSSASAVPNLIHSARDVSSSGEKYGTAEDWREETYEKLIPQEHIYGNILSTIQVLKKRYLSEVEDMYHYIAAKLKQLNLQPEHQNSHLFLSLKDAIPVVGQLLMYLNIRKERLVPEHTDSLANMLEERIIVFLNRFDKFKRHVAASLPQAHSPKVQPEQERQPQQSQAPETDHTFRNSHHPKVDTDQNITVSSTPSSVLPTPTHHELEQQQRLAIKPLGKRKQDSSSDNHNETLGSQTQSPIKRLVNIVGSISSHALSSSLGDLLSVVQMTDGMEASGPGEVGCEFAVGQDLSWTTKCRRMMKARKLSSLSRVSLDMSNDQEKNPALKSPAKNCRKRLLEEIAEVNQRLVDTVVDLCEEEDINGKGTVVRCCFSGVSVNSNLIKSVSMIQPLRLLVPTDYPDSDRCPVVLHNLPGEVGDGLIDMISDKTNSRLTTALQRRPNKDRISIGEIAQMWEFCVRGVIIEYAEKYGGGTFSSKYVVWDDCL